MAAVGEQVTDGRPAIAESAATRRTIHGIRVVAACAILTALAFVQEPGRIVADTKIDLVVNPVGFLERALHLWDPTASFGQVQNQTYGYLWPMGPFFAGGGAIGLPGWVIQRLWWAVLMCVACTGVIRLATRLGIGSPGARIVAGIAFALSPRILTLIGADSIEAWPMALAPWVLIPLIGLAYGARLRPAVTRSAIAIACAGGVNGTAVLAILPPALIWLAMLRPRWRRLAALLAWAAAVSAATSWWVAPLLILGRYSPPILDYTETAAVTTRVTDTLTILRGASNWVGFHGTPYGSWWPAGGELALQPALIIATLAVAAFGVAGLARPGMPHRRFLIGCLVVGLALVGFGHASDLWGTLGTWERPFLSGPGAALRNVHKFDVVLRLPLALGLAHVCGLLFRLAGRVPGRTQLARLPVIAAAAAVLAAIGGAAAPAIVADLAARGSFTQVPGYWHEAADWLNQRAGRDRVLVLPAAQFPTYQWGSTGDEVAQPLLTADWAVRNVAPDAPPGTIRLMDAIEAAISTGSGSLGLSDILARSGVKYVLLRSDLDYGRSAATRPLVVRQALARSPGLSRVAGFGPEVDGDHPEGMFLDHGMNVATQALEVFRVDRDVAPVVAYDADDVTTVVGGPESLLDLSAAGQLNDAPVILAGDLPSGSAMGGVVLTDGLRRREVAFGLLHDNSSATLTAKDPYTLEAPAHDYLPGWADDSLTTVAYRGITSVTASSSWSQAGLLFGSRPEHQPYAALDGDLTTSWRPAPGTPNEGQWIEIELATPQRVPELKLTFDVKAQALPTKLTVTVGSEDTKVEGFGAEYVIPLSGTRATRTIRVRVDEVVDIGGQYGNFGLSDVEIPGVTPARTLKVPVGPKTAAPAAVVLSAAPTTPACFFVGGLVRCAASAKRGSEDGGRVDRTVNLANGASYGASVWMRPRPGPELDALLDAQVAANNSLGLATQVTASSTAIDDPAARPGAVVDGDPETVWTPDLIDKSPLLHLTFYEKRVVTGVRITLPKDAAVARPGAVRVIGDGGTTYGFLNTNGELYFPQPITTDDLTILLYGPTLTQSYDPYGNFAEPVAMGVGELTALPDLPNPAVDLDKRVRLDCGTGPDLYVGSFTVQTRVNTTRRELLELRESKVELCGGGRQLRLPSGLLRIVATSSPLASPIRVALAPNPGAVVSSPAASTVGLVDWSAAHRLVKIEPRASARVMVMRENTNPGWQATAADGRVLKPIVVDGWQQGFLVPAGVAGNITIAFVPDRAYRLALLVGAALLLAVLVAALRPGRRVGVHSAAARRGAPDGSAFVATGAVALIAVGGAIGAMLVLIAIASQLPALRPGFARWPRRRALRGLGGWLAIGLIGAGGWALLTAPDPHHVGWAQGIGLLTVGALWLSAVPSDIRRIRRSTAPPLRAQPQEWLFDQVIAGGREREGERSRQ